MKRFGCLSALFALLFLLCACSGGQADNTPPGGQTDNTPPGGQTESPDAPPESAPPSGADAPPVSITLSADEHPELDFGAVNGERAIWDFAVVGGEVCILQRDGSVLRYSQDGALTETYRLNVYEQGLTASRIAFSGETLYLLDGHNNAILTAEQSQVTHVSRLSFTDIGMVTNFYAQENGMLVMTFADIEGAYTAEVDPSGADVKIVGEKQSGYLICENTTYLPAIAGGGGGADRVDVAVYRSGQLLESFGIGSAEKSRIMAGLSIYGISGEDWFGLLHEFVVDEKDPPQEQYVQTAVRFNTKEGRIKTSESAFAGDVVIRVSKSDSYCLCFSENALTIKPIAQYFSDWAEGDTYVLTHD